MEDPARDGGVLVVLRLAQLQERPLRERAKTRLAAIDAARGRIEEKPFRSRDGQHARAREEGRQETAAGGRAQGSDLPGRVRPAVAFSSRSSARVLCLVDDLTGHNKGRGTTRRVWRNRGWG